jgi:exonuclease SbcC
VTIVQLEQGLREENQAISLTATLKEESQKISLSKDKLEELQVSVAQLEKNKAQAESTVTDKERLLVQSRLISKYEDDRTKLVADEACYLCGSTEHPYVDHQVQLSVNEDEAALLQAKGTLEEIVKQLNHSNQEHTKLLEQINSKEAFLQREQENLNRLNEAVKGIIAQNGSNAFWKGSIKETHSFLQNELISVQSAIVQLEELELKINTQKQQSTEINERLNTANTSLALAQQQIESTNSNISKAQSRLAELKVKLDLIITGLTQKLTPFGVNYSNGVSNILSERSQAFIEKQLVLEKEQIKVQKLIANLSGITASITAIETDKTGKQKTLESTKKLIDDNINKRGEVLDWKFNVADSRTKYKEQIQQANANAEASNTTLVDAELNFGNKKTSLNDLVQQIQKENFALTQVAEVLNNAVKNLNFSSIEAMALAILTQVQVNEIETEAAAISKLLTESETLFKNSEAELDELVLQDMGEIVIDDLIIEAPKYKETIKQLSENLGKISAQITANENQENSAKQILQEIEKQLAIKQRWSQLNELIGSADGKKFKAIAQEFTLEYLVALANNYLQNISDRYSLIPKPDLQLSIADAYQSGSERSVSTLSGGESFLVSLSLALGLSDMAGNRTHIGSLFIDEGFGTLDPETLDVAISALENLQHSRNKSIGIISHVEALKERITTQIEVVKGKSGRSYIKPFELSVMA